MDMTLAVRRDKPVAMPASEDFATIASTSDHAKEPANRRQGARHWSIRSLKMVSTLPTSPSSAPATPRTRSLWPSSPPLAASMLLSCAASASSIRTEPSSWSLAMKQMRMEPESSTGACICCANYARSEAAEVRAHLASALLVSRAP